MPGERKKTNRENLIRVGDVLPDIAKGEFRPLTPIQERLVSMPSEDGECDIVYQHSVLCQTCMPYEDPKDVRLWQRKNGFVTFELCAGRVLDPRTGAVVDVPLPFGPKARLVLFHLQSEAVRRRSPVIEMDESLTRFCVHTLRLSDQGRNIRTVKEQLNRLAAADFRIYMSAQGHAVTIKGTVVEGIDIWVARDERERILWPAIVKLSERYFQSLLLHAVPLSEEAIARLSHSAVALDIYAWLAQRLHRVIPAKPAFLPWTALKEQFGQGYSRMDNFRAFFCRELRSVHAVYRDARFEINRGGMILRHSRPPVPPHVLPVR